MLFCSGFERFGLNVTNKAARTVYAATIAAAGMSLACRRQRDGFHAKELMNEFRVRDEDFRFGKAARKIGHKVQECSGLVPDLNLIERICAAGPAQAS